MTVDVKDFNLIREIMELSVVEVIEAMTSMDVAAVSELGQSIESLPKSLTVAITFRNGVNFNGVFIIKMQYETSWECTRRILNNMPGITESDVIDAVGEILNIVVGKFKAILTSHNYELFDFSPPIHNVDATRLQQLTANRAKQLVIPFQTPQGALAIEIHFD